MEYKQKPMTLTVFQMNEITTLTGGKGEGSVELT